VETEEDLMKEKRNEISFLRKFFELQGLMLHHNSQLTKSHPYSSSPVTWPFVVRGISFWESAEGLKQIYLLGNPFAWYFICFIFLIFFFVSYQVVVNFWTGILCSIVDF
jgi:dolichyl-phosphate-mannose-protein mannosyltransferase